jgi:Protein of unknown function DUF58
VPTTRGWLVLGWGAVLGVAGWVFGVEEFVLVALSAVSVVAWAEAVAHRRSRRARRSLGISVTMPVAEATVGDEVTALLRLRAQREALAPLELEDPAASFSVSHPGLGGRMMPDEAHGAPAQRRRARRGRPPSLSLPAIRRGAEIVLALRVPTTRRGVVELVPPAAWCEDPLGLVAVGVAPASPADAGRRPGCGSRLLVCPRPAARRPGATEGANGPNAANGANAAGTVAAGRLAHALLASVRSPSGDELDCLRPYVPGDRLTRLHWQALARTGELVVRSFTAGDTGRLTLLVDVRPGAAHGALDAAASAAAWIGDLALAGGTTVELCTSAGERVLLAPDPSGRLGLRRALAMIGPSLPGREHGARWHASAALGALWATDNLADAGQVLVSTDAAAHQTLPLALASRTEVVVV